MATAKKISLTKKERTRLLEVIRKFKKAKVLVIGDFILDRFVWGSVDRISPEAPVPVVNVHEESYMPGGSLNAANNVRTLGGTVYPCGVVGRDLEGRLLLKAMRREGIDTGGIVYDPSRPTSLKTRIIAHSQQVVRFDRENGSDVSKQDCRSMIQFISSRIKTVDSVIIEDYGKGVIQPSLLKEILNLARKYKKPILIDPKEKHFSYYAGATAITPNRKEAFQAVDEQSLKGEKTIDAVGKHLLKKLKLEAVLLTMGEDGMALYEKKGGITRIPTMAQEVYDVSGAGDTVIAAFSLALGAGATMKEAAVLANLSAGLVVAKLGTATVSAKELQKLIEKSGA